MSNLEPCPKCGKEVPCVTALDDGEDVRWAEWSCPCGLYYHAESRIVDERGVHDAEAELAELHAAWNTRAVRTTTLTYEHTDSKGWRERHGRCQCGNLVEVAEFIGEGSNGDYMVVQTAPYCEMCGAKVVDE